MSLTEPTADENKFFESGGEVLPPESVTNTPEPAPTAPEPESAPNRQGTVPFDAFHEVKQTAKELREELRRREEEIRQAREEARAAWERAEKYSTTFERFLAEQSKQAAPKYEEDPLSYFKHENEQLKKQLETLDTGVKQTKEEFQKQQGYQAFATQVRSAEESFKSKAPDYDHAVAFLKQTRLQDFADLGFSEADATMALQNEIMGLAQAAIQKGKSPAEVAYNMAKRYGYKSQNDNEQEIQRLQKGQEASKALAGGKADTPITLDALAQLDDEQLDALIKDDKAWRKLSGR